MGRGIYARSKYWHTALQRPTLGIVSLSTLMFTSPVAVEHISFLFCFFWLPNEVERC